MKISSELIKKLDEMADIIYKDDEAACKFAKEGIREDGDLLVVFDSYDEFEKRKPRIEEKCWARGLVLVCEGKGYIIKAEEWKS